MPSCPAPSASSRSILWLIAWATLAALGAPAQAQTEPAVAVDGGILVTRGLGEDYVLCVEQERELRAALDTSRVLMEQARVLTAEARDVAAQAREIEAQTSRLNESCRLRLSLAAAEAQDARNALAAMERARSRARREAAVWRAVAGASTAAAVVLYLTR